MKVANTKQGCIIGQRALKRDMRTKLALKGLWWFKEGHYTGEKKKQKKHIPMNALHRTHEAKLYGGTSNCIGLLKSVTVSVYK